jgi:hypothetical protein
VEGGPGRPGRVGCRVQRRPPPSGPRRPLPGHPGRPVHPGAARATGPGRVVAATGPHRCQQHRGLTTAYRHHRCPGPLAGWPGGVRQGGPPVGEHVGGRAAVLARGLPGRGRWSGSGPTPS